MLFKLAICFLLSLAALQAGENRFLVNASYDVSREFYAEYNSLFTSFWQSKTGESVKIKQSHAGSSTQARAVVEGLDVDVVTLNQGWDLDVIAKRGRNLIGADWRSKFPNQASPYISVVAMMVREGNPKGIKDWNDLAREDISIVVPNPKTSGNGRYAYLALWAYANEQFSGDAGKIGIFLGKVYKNVRSLERGGRSSTVTFVHRGIGDVLLNCEAEIITTLREIGKNKFQLLYPEMSVEAALPVAVVDRVVDRHGSRLLATEYLNYLWSEEAQNLLAKHGYRPRNKSVSKSCEALFPRIRLVTVEGELGGWAKVHEEHFREGALFDRIYAAAKMAKK